MCLSDAHVDAVMSLVRGDIVVSKCLELLSLDRSGMKSTLNAASNVSEIYCVRIGVDRWW